ncbi:acetyl/propionyl/methylcrotonyl-CoA carboxylase subunit alpha [Nocardioides daejeonensis]|uniref:acetyl/propionyl/methylcrotonyl-CoA carboxylase subunit alpha n=1 Tax=Nocardioides daejeonensis TaxID=1046556 RepID=UPI000D74562E|nr:biotin carboxylase N-terminal domain-containing protein [Nocardioides daejeonensis]
MATIKKLLIANRGEIASRIIRSARAMDIACVAVFSDADADAPFVTEADEAVRLPGTSPTDTYLRGDLILEAARQTGADAVHPGYGFLSENAGFARACAAAGVIFVGPPPEAIDSMGSKIEAKKIMAAAGVPVLPGITIETDSEIDGAQLGSRVSDEIGYPVLVKAAFGGGGRGMRIVRESSDLLEAVEGARREAVTAFGDGTIFLERYLDVPRHIEVQLFADTQGTVVHLFERECSIQRRYQKIIEEAPSPVVDDALRDELGAAAIAAGKAIGYVGAGTAEFVMGSDGRFYFLEVNTRLQVEHPVTELITGLDLVRLQLLVAEGHPLPTEAVAADRSGHAIEVRLYAEDVDAGFLPATGTIQEFSVPALPGIRVDSGVVVGSEVGVHYDPMLAKIIGYGPTRDDARRVLARALAESRVDGVVTNRDLLVGILREEEFAAGQIDTGYLGRHEPVDLMRSWRSPDLVRVHAAAAALAAQAAHRAAAAALPTLPSGWRNVSSQHQHVSYLVDGNEVDVRYRVRRGTVEVSVDGEELTGARVWAATPDLVDIEVDGVRRRCDVRVHGESVNVTSALGSLVLVEQARFSEPGDRNEPGSLLAPMPGTVVRVLVEEGQPVEEGATVLVIEAMKMEHSVKAPVSGVASLVRVQVGQAVELGTVLAVVEEEAP